VIQESEGMYMLWPEYIKGLKGGEKKNSERVSAHILEEGVFRQGDKVYGSGRVCIVAVCVLQCGCSVSRKLLQCVA
jgi:hypothetical protein